MRYTPIAAALAASLSTPLAAPAPAPAAPVLVVEGARAAPADDPYLPAPAGPTAAAAASARSAASSTGSERTRTFKRELARLRDKGSLDAPTAGRARAAYDRAVRAARHVGGRRRRELRAVTTTADQIAADRRLSPSRVPALTLILRRNSQLWGKTSSLPAPGGRIEFAGSEIVWQYYAGQGLQIQPLGTFGRANGLWTAGDQDTRLRRLFEEMVPLAARRGSALAWEYYFSFGGGSPPWVSGMAQATGLQALSRAITRLGEDRWRAIVPRALKLFRLPPPTGVRVKTAAGARYLQYSFDPGQKIINAFLQTVLGLYTTADELSDRVARRLAKAGDAQARAELPLYDTGAWALYDLGGSEATLDYYTLAQSFLERLCDRFGGESVYCDTFVRWDGYLRTPPRTRLVTRSAVAGETTRVRFRLDKASEVDVAIESPEGGTVLSTSARFRYGTRYVTFTPAEPGTYTVRLEARDLAGNRAQSEAELEVAPASAPVP